MLYRELAPLLERALMTLTAEGHTAAGGEAFDYPFELPRNARHGDVASPLALVLAAKVGLAPWPLAEALAAAMACTGPLAAVTAARPGFLNFRMADDWLRQVPERILALPNFRGPAAERPCSVLVQVVLEGDETPRSASAARRVAIAAAMANALAAVGHDPHTVLIAGNAGSGFPPTSSFAAAFEPLGLFFGELTDGATPAKHPAGEAGSPNGRVNGPRAAVETGAESLPTGLALASGRRWLATGGDRVVTFARETQGTAWQTRLSSQADPRSWQLMPCEGLAWAPGTARSEETPWAPLIDSVGKATLRFAWLLQPAHQFLACDPAALAREAIDNPVFFLRHALARLEAVLRLAEERGPVSLHPTAVANRQPAGEERALWLVLARYPDELRLAASLAHPHRLAGYGIELATAFQRFYAVCRVFDDECRLTTQERLLLAGATAKVLRHAFETVTGARLTRFLAEGEAI